MPLASLCLQNGVLAFSLCISKALFGSILSNNNIWRYGSSDTILHAMSCDMPNNCYKLISEVNSSRGLLCWSSQKHYLTDNRNWSLRLLPKWLFSQLRRVHCIFGSPTKYLPLCDSRICPSSWPCQQKQNMLSWERWLDNLERVCMKTGLAEFRGNKR